MNLHRHPLKITFLLNRQIVNPALIVTLGYMLLAGLRAANIQHPAAAWLAALLAVMGTGVSTVSLLFPKPGSLDLIEWIGLSISLSLGIGGTLSFILSRTEWKLTLWSSLVAAWVFNLLCAAAVMYLRKNLEPKSIPVQIGLPAARPSQRGSLDMLKTSVLVICLAGGAWLLLRQVSNPAAEPPMTEFFLLGQDGATDAYPQAANAGERVQVKYGIANRTGESASYQVKAYLNNREIGVSQEIEIAPSRQVTGQLDFQLGDATTGPNKVMFVLYRAGVSHRFLYLWLDITNP